MRIAFFVLCLLRCPILFSQKPVISPGGIVSAATFIGGSNGPTYLSPGTLASIFGANFSAGSPDASVLVNGQPAPVLFVASNQINFQIPANVQRPNSAGQFFTANVVVRTPSGDSNPAIVTLQFANFGLFSLDGSGCGRAAALNVASDGTVSLNSPDSSASPGQFVTLFGTGASTPPLDELGYPYFFLNETTTNLQPATYLGPAPGLVGVDQVNIQLHPTLRRAAPFLFV